MFSKISNRNKTIGPNNITPSKLIETIEKIEKEINDSKKNFKNIINIKNFIIEKNYSENEINFKKEIIKKIEEIIKQNNIKKSTYNNFKKELSIYELHKSKNKDLTKIKESIKNILQLLASKKYYNDLKNIFKKYSSCKTCKENKEDCKKNKYNYYTKLKKLFSLNNLIKDEIFKDFYPSKKRAEDDKIIYIYTENKPNNNYNLYNNYKVIYPNGKHRNNFYHYALEEEKARPLIRNNYRFQIIYLITEYRKTLSEKINKYKLSVDEIDDVNKRNILKQKIIDEIKVAKEKYKNSFLKKYNNLDKDNKINIYKNASKIYYEDIVNFYKKYDSIKPCGLQNKNIDKIKICEANKEEYYIMLYDTIKEQNIKDFLLYRPPVNNTENYKRGREDYDNLLATLVVTKDNLIISKQHKHCKRSGKENCNPEQKGGKKHTKKTTIKKPTKKTTIKNPTKKT